MEKSKNGRAQVWRWVPTLYFAEGIPYVLVVTLSVIFYKRMGVSNADITLYTSWLYLPWVLKFLWSPIVDLLKTKRFWILIMQIFIGAGLAGVAFTVPVPNFFKYTLAFFWLMAFSSATHDIAADGFYMLALSKNDQTFFVGIRSTFYRIASLTGQGLLVILAGYFESRSSLPPVEVKVAAVNEIIMDGDFNPEEIVVSEDSTAMYFMYAPEVRVSTEKQASEKIQRQLEYADAWNVKNGFYGLHEIKEKDKVSWWKENVSAPLSEFLTAKFADAKKVSESGMSGNIAYTWFCLSKKPESGETVVLNFTHETGDKSIQLVRDYRYEFNEDNWNIPALAVFQLDATLSNPTIASFKGLSGNIKFAWGSVFIIIAVVFVVLYLYHRWALPKPDIDKPTVSEGKGVLREFLMTFVSFFKKKQVGVMLLFLLVYRLGESQLVKLSSPFLLDSREANGLGLTTGELGLIYGTIGMISLTLGGILGGIVASKKGLKYWMWWMVLAMNLPNLVYVFLSYLMPSSLWIIGASVAVEQFGYGFGFTAYMLYMIYISEGPHKTAHFAIATALMASGMMFPGMISGWLQEIIGYQNFFIWVMICTIPAFAIIPFLKIDPEFGKKTNETGDNN